MIVLSEEMPKCRICQATGAQNKRAEHVFGGGPEHSFWHCECCDAVYLYPIPSEDAEKFFYAQEFEKFMAERSGKERDWSGVREHINTNQDQVKRRLPFLAPHMKKGGRLLEIGCSSGFMLDAFTARGMQCVGIEPSGVFYEHLKERKTTVFKNLDELETSGEKGFDLIVNFFVLEHIRDPFSFIRRSMALLNEGGTFIAEIPCVNDPLTSIYSIPAFEKFYWSIAHHYYYSPKCLKFIVDSLGWRHEMVPEQRYDLSNHIIWMTEGKPGGQGRFDNIFSPELIEMYKENLKENWRCDTLILYIFK